MLRTVIVTARSRDLPDKSVQSKRFKWPHIHCNAHKSPPLDRIVSQCNPVHTLTTYLCKLHYNVVPQCTPAFLHSSVIFRFSNKIWVKQWSLLPQLVRLRISVSSKNHFGNDLPVIQSGNWCCGEWLGWQWAYCFVFRSGKSRFRIWPAVVTEAIASFCRNIWTAFPIEN